MKELPKDYVDSKQLCEKYAFLTRNVLKNMLNKNIGGFRDAVVHKVGRKLYYNEEALLKFFADCKESNTKAC